MCVYFCLWTLCLYVSRASLLRCSALPALVKAAQFVWATAALIQVLVASFAIWWQSPCNVTLMMHTYLKIFQTYKFAVRILQARASEVDTDTQRACRVRVQLGERVHEVSLDLCFEPICLMTIPTVIDPCRCFSSHLPCSVPHTWFYAPKHR